MTNSVVLRNAKFVETTFSDGSKQMVGTVRGDSFVGLELPTKPNPRQFIGEANLNYKEMVKTLISEPEMFARKNSSGITIFASSCDSNGDGSFTITFGDEDGIANGGHTYHALKAHGRDVSQVKVTIEIGINRANIGKVAEALNLNKRLQVYSLKNKEGAFDWHKNCIEEKAADVIYHEGDSGTVEIKEEVAFLNLFKHDGETKKIDILLNIEQSEHANVSFLNRVNASSTFFENTLKWIAKDVHEIASYALFNEEFVIQLKPLKSSVGQNWIKKRGAEKKTGILKGIGLLLVAGLASVGVEVNRNGVVKWKQQYATYEQRKLFVDELFKKVFDIVSVEDGNASDIIRKDSVRKRVLKHSRLIHAQLAPRPVVKRRVG
ncbi:hypothetical protein COJ01_17890 [Priestia megaterium]|uniref:AIPR family protein n=1 Tax=Priestia megaterium TaxID=1404 RepID=UPI000BF62529|nr:AIPR family protein [Priestia megaterium]PFK99919.1 hypothetical protein COJ01_17890 [Priestia megaterium]